MFLFPFRKLRFFTHLSARQAGDRIKENMDLGEESSFWLPRIFRKFSNRYSGAISGKSFTMERNIRYRNSWLPQIEGELKPDKQGTEIEIRMKPGTYAIGFGIFWGIVNAIIAIAMMAFFWGDAPKLALLAIPASLMGGFYLWKWGQFALEARIAKKDLEKWLEMVEPKKIE